ncbi:MAG TPA: hypothetical protein VMU33_10140 [Burkholderiaceae bacterium]|nr:hypothetical protein [Burkholderiaceae bacterium]
MYRRCLVVSFAAALAACAAPSGADDLASANDALARSGSPYRWQEARGADGVVRRERTIAGTPGPSMADDASRRGILASIAQVESTCGADPAATKLVETRQLSAEDVRTREIWVVARAERRVAYVVTLVKGETTDFFVRGVCE